MNSKEELARLKTTLDPIVFNRLREIYGKALKDFWETASFPATSSNTVLMVEPRCHPNLEFCLHNFMYFTYDKKFSLTIVCSNQNLQFIKQILGKHQSTTRILPLFEDIEEGPKQLDHYNYLFRRWEFWNQIEAEWILSVQTDAYLRKPLPDLLWEYQYLAAPWNWYPYLVGGGGLTFRKKSTVLHICKTLKSNNYGIEDSYFATAVQFFDIPILPLEQSREIFFESTPCNDPVGVHQWWTFAGEFLTTSPELFTLMFEVYTTLLIPDEKLAIQNEQNCALDCSQSTEKENQESNEARG
jgi:hypothetical protein